MAGESSVLGRRTLLSGAAGLGAAALLSGCGSPGRAPAASASRTPLVGSDASATEKVVNWSNWPQYIDVAGGRRPTLDAFARQTGIKVNYNEDYNDNDEFFAKVRPLLEAGQDTGRDLWVSTDWMVARMIRLGYLLPLDYANIPNGKKNLEPSLSNPEFDSGCVYSLPWAVTFAGIAYNPKSTGGRQVTSIDQLLHDSSLKGKVTLLTEMRDTVGQVMIEAGADITKFTAADFSSAIGVIQAAKDAGQIKAFTGNDYTKPLISGDTAACLAWTGDVVQLKADNPSLGYALPSAGYSVGSDCLVIPAMARHKTNAEKLINYYYQPEVMAQVVDYINYVGPVVGVKQILMKTDPGVANDELIFPSQETLARGQIFRSLTAAEETDFTNQFQTLVAG